MEPQLCPRCGEEDEHLYACEACWDQVCESCYCGAGDNDPIFHSCNKCDPDPQ